MKATIAERAIALLKASSNDYLRSQAAELSRAYENSWNARVDRWQAQGRFWWMLIASWLVSFALGALLF